MPVIVPIRDLRNTNEISDMAHKTRGPIFVTKNGYSDLVIMSSEYYDHFVEMNQIDMAIRNAEMEVSEGAEPIPAEKAFEILDKKYYGSL